MRRILYLTGTRADFGLMRVTLERINASARLELGLAITGMHLDPYYGETVHEVEASGLPIVAKIPVALRSDDGAVMARAIATELVGLVDVLTQFRPDLLLLLGDRGEMLAGAIAALHLNIPIVHLHGGERSGSVDEPVRHAISKLAHIHLTATVGSRERLIRMGECPEHIFVTGAPGLDALIELQPASREMLCTDYGLRSDLPIALVIFHPVVQHSSQAADQISTVLDALSDVPHLQYLLIAPNADAGSEAMREVIALRQGSCHVISHLPHARYVEWLARADVLVGNSSSGIIEAATFGTPVVNVGQRQYARERSANVRDVEVVRDLIANAIVEALAEGRRPVTNLYGDGYASERIVTVLEDFPLTSSLLLKCNDY